MQIVFSIITIILIFTTIYSYGLLITNTIYKNQKTDFFFNILIGYTLIGLITVIFHFFLEINNYFSLILIIVGILIFISNYIKIEKKEFIQFALIIVLLSFILFAFSEHPIDANMYHHPYVAYLKSEKIIFAVANLQFRFGHISLLQYVQAAVTNNFFHEISLASLNIIFYICFIFFFLKEILGTKHISIVFIIKILLVSFILIKFARYREHGNDLIPLLVSVYFFIKIISLDKYNKIDCYKYLYLALPYAAFMFLHKISYVFTCLIFLSIFSLNKFQTRKIINFKFVIIFIILMVPWLIKNYIVTSCLAYPVEISCFPNTLYELQGRSIPLNASWLTEIWAKGFVDHPNWQELNLKEYANGFNWVPTWFQGHFIKILEITLPLIVLILLITLYLFLKKRDFLLNKNKKNIPKFYIILYLTNLAGLLIWFYKAPVFRYGSFYIITFIILSYLLLTNYHYKLKKSKNIKFFKLIFLISFSFFILKNISRINNSDLAFFPKTFKNANEYIVINKNNLKLLKPKSDICYFTKNICSHEIPSNIKLKKIGKYYISSN